MINNDIISRIKLTIRFQQSLLTINWKFRSDFFEIQSVPENKSSLTILDIPPWKRYRVQWCSRLLFAGFLQTTIGIPLPGLGERHNIWKLKEKAHFFPGQPIYAGWHLLPEGLCPDGCPGCHPSTSRSPPSQASPLQHNRIIILKLRENLYTGCSLNVVFSFSKISKYSGLWPFSVFPRCQCSRTHRVEKNHKILKKKHNI